MIDKSDFASSKGWNYERSVGEIEHIVTRIESGELELAQVFEEFATAVKYLQQCEIFLQEKRQQVNLAIENLVDDPETF